VRRAWAAGVLVLATLGLFSVPGLSVRAASANATPRPPGAVSPSTASKDTASKNTAHQRYLQALRARKLAAAQAKAAAEHKHAQAVATGIWSREGRPPLLTVIGPDKVLLVENGMVRRSMWPPKGPLSIGWLARELPAQWATYDAATRSARFTSALAVTDGSELDAEPGDVAAVRLGDGAAVWVSRGTFRAGAVAISSYDPRTGGTLPVTDSARPFIRAGLGARLDFDGTVIAALGNRAAPDESGVTWGRGAMGEASQLTVSGDYTGLRLASSRLVALEDVSISHSAFDGLVLENDSGTTLSGVASTDNGHDGVRLGFGPDRRTLKGVTTSGNQDYGALAVGMAGLTVLGFTSHQDVEGGIRLKQCTSCSVVDPVTNGDRVGVRVDAESRGTSITGGTLSGGDTGVDTAAALSVSGTAISGASVGLHAAAGAEVRADRVSINALRTGAHLEAGGGLLLSGSTVLAPVGIKGRVVYSGHNTVALPPFPWLGVVAIAAIVLGLLLETVHALRQAGRFSTRSTAPDHVLNTA
jgi:Right handed beta helix region